MFFFFFDQHATALLDVANSSEIKEVMESDEYYFQKALDKYEEFKKLDVKDAILDDLITRTKETPFSYAKLLTAYGDNTPEYIVLRVIGELVSYIDQKAAMKNTLNEYIDKRTMALAFVRQNIWVQYLLKFKRNDQINELPEVIQNAIRYIEQPEQNISVFSDKRKEQIFNRLFEGKDGDLFECMHEIGIKSRNPMNDGYVYSKILHSESIRKLWDTDEKDDNGEQSFQQKTWAFAPGEDACMWDEFKEKGIIAIGWDETGDLTQYDSKDEIKEQLTATYGTESNHMNKGLALWQFCNEIQISDTIYAKVGSKTLLGIGEVTSDYEYDDSRKEYKHVRKVNWIKTGRWELNEKFAIKVLTEITAFEDFCKNTEKVANAAETLQKEIADLPEPIREIYEKPEFLSDVFLSDEQYDTLIELVKRKKNIILQGAPGVGKTYAARRLAYSFMGEKDESRVKIIQFHQSYSYDDFIMGYRPDDDGFTLKFGPFHKFCERAESNPDKPYFFIIDEINRGNLSKIFGELLMLIECDKRGEKIPLMYSDKDFSVPENLYIIGMMNTADRSLAMIDYALRRRFCFFELEPAFETNAFKQYLLDQGLDNSLITKIIKKLSYLNTEIACDPNLGKGFRIGHSYFCNCENISNGWYEMIIKYEIAPLLEEYWFDDPETAENHINELLRR